MKAGTLRHKVLIYNLVETQSSVTGQLTHSWSSSPIPAWASIQPLRGREAFEVSQRLPEVMAKITIRYTTGVSVKGKVTHGSTDYQIEAVVPIDERNVMMELWCSRVMA